MRREYDFELRNHAKGVKYTYCKVNEIPSGRYTMELNRQLGSVSCESHDFVLDEHYFDRIKAREYEARRIISDREDELLELKVKARLLLNVVGFIASSGIILYGMCLPGLN